MGSGASPTVSVVIPTHNRRRLLRTTLTSVLDQEAVDLQVIVVDDGSQDGTEAMVRAIGDSRLEVIRHPVARGVSAARNAGIAAAEGAWVALLDDDDVWAPSKLRRQIAAALEVGAGFVYCGAFTFERGSEGVLADRDAPPAARLSALLQAGNPLPGGCSAQVIDRVLAARLGGFDESLLHVADWDMWLRVTRETSPAAVPERLVAYRVHGGNRVVVLRAKAHIREFDRLAVKHGLPFDGAGFHFWVASGQRRGGRRAAAVGTHLRAAARYRHLGHLGTAVRVPLGDWALGVRHREKQVPLPTPAWLASLDGKVELWP